MRIGFWALAGLVVIAGCGGKSERDSGGHSSDPPTTVTGAPCVTSEACADGLRCDSGVCVADTECPAAEAPKLLFDPAVGSPWSGRYPNVIEAGGHELAVSYTTDLAATTLHFHDLASEEESTLEHPPGVTYCLGSDAGLPNGNPSCYSLSGSAFTLLRGLSLSGQTWSAASVQRYAIAGSPIGSAADLAARRLPVWSEDDMTVSVLDLDSAAVLFSVPLPADLLGVASDAQGRSAAIKTSKNDPSSSVVQSAPLREGTTFSVVYQGEPLKLNEVLLTNGATQYAVRENGLADYHTTRVERVSNALPLTIGTFSDPPLTAIDYGYEDKPLEAGTAMYALDCASGGQCRSFLIHLDPVKVELVSQAPWPDGRPAWVVNIRRLACGARDLVLVTSDDANVTNHLWSLRLAGRAGLP